MFPENTTAEKKCLVSTVSPFSDAFLDNSDCPSRGSSYQACEDEREFFFLCRCFLRRGNLPRWVCQPSSPPPETFSKLKFFDVRPISPRSDAPAWSVLILTCLVVLTEMASDDYDPSLYSPETRTKTQQTPNTCYVFLRLHAFFPPPQQRKSGWFSYPVTFNDNVIYVMGFFQGAHPQCHLLSPKKGLDFSR